jgi:3-oxoacyl-[acyl-carrier protein] reductase
MTTTSSNTTPSRVAIVTGGSGGIGRAVAERLSDDGMAVVVHYSQSRDLAEQVVNEITARGARAIAMPGDVADEVEMKDLFDETERVFGGVDVVVHTAGVLLLSTLTQLRLEDLDRLMRTNVRGTFVIDQLAMQRVRRGGAIINFSTSVVRRAVPTYAAYAASKAAVDAMTMILAKEMRGRDVTVNAVAPGPTATPMFLNSRDEAAVETLAKMAALERIGEPNDIAEVVSFLAGEARWINGQVIYADGGLL